MLFNPLPPVKWLSLWLLGLSSNVHVLCYIVFLSFSGVDVLLLHCYLDQPGDLCAWASTHSQSITPTQIQGWRNAIQDTNHSPCCHSLPCVVPQSKPPLLMLLIWNVLGNKGICSCQSMLKVLMWVEHNLQ